MLSPFWSERHFISFDKTPIFYRHRVPAQQARGNVLILHGMGEHGGRYGELADFLAELGLASFIPDLRGFGRSGGRRVSIRSFDEFWRDVDILRAFILRAHKAPCFFYIGHSFGGLVLASYLAERSSAQDSGLILSSPLFGIALPVQPPQRLLALCASRLFPDLRQPTNVAPTDLTRDDRILSTYAQDPLIDQRISVRLYAEMSRVLSDREQIAKKLRLPTLIQQAGEDRIVSRASTEDFYQKLASSSKTLRVYDGLLHEILNEVQRGRVLTDMRAWILERLSHK